MKIYIILFMAMITPTALYPSQSFAEDSAEQMTKVLFGEKFADQSIYSEGNCSSNIWRFLKASHANAISLDSAIVIYFFNRNLEDIKLLNPRSEENTYFYHVVLLFNGQIFDFDFSNKPRVLPFDEYFNKQVFEDKKMTGKLILKGIPALEYLRDYSMSPFDQKNYYYYLLPEYESYRENSYSQFKDIFVNKH